MIISVIHYGGVRDPNIGSEGVSIISQDVIWSALRIQPMPVGFIDGRMISFLRFHNIHITFSSALGGARVVLISHQSLAVKTMGLLIGQSQTRLHWQASLEPVTRDDAICRIPWSSGYHVVSPFDLIVSSYSDF